MRIDYPRRGRTGARRFVPSWRQVLGLLTFGVAAGIAAFIALYLMIDVPQPNQLATAQTTVVYYDDGKNVIGRFAEVNREIVSIEDIPDEVELAVLAAEDRSFYENEGISPVGIARALWNNLTGGDTQGASTITQQYARNAYLTQEQTLQRKVKEAILAIKLTRGQTKDEVLENYLNTIYFGRGAYGIQAASQAYFGRDVQDLTVAQGAVLAAVIRAPSSYDPAEGPEAEQALEARVLDYVIPGMVEQGWLTEAEAAEITALPRIRDPQALNTYRGQTGFLLDVVRDELKDLGFTKAEIDAGGLRITTTFDRQAQAAAQAAATEGFPPPPNDGVKVGLVSVEPGTGRIVAMYGGKNWERSQFNNAIAPVPVGSTMKAYTVAAALQNGYSLTSTFDGNSPFYIEDEVKPVFNQGDVSYGSAISLQYATERSVNTAFVDLAEQMGPQEVAEAAGEAGLDVDNLYADSPRVTLGSAAYSPLTMAEGYATFAAEGVHAEPFSVLSVEDAGGQVLYEAQQETQRAFPADVANEVTYDLAQVVQAGTGAYARNLGRPAAGKTGNHEGETAWFIGYTPQLVTAVAFHRELPGDPLAPLNGVAYQPVFTGAGYPTQIWTMFMAAALEGTEVLPLPGRPVPTTSPSPSPTTSSPSPSPSPTTSSPEPSPSPTKTRPSPSATSAEPSPSEQAQGGEQAQQ